MKTKKDTRNSLIEVTSELMNLKGYHGTGMNEILKMSGLPRGSLYHHFPKGKDELISAALEHAALLKADQFRKAMKGKATAEQGLEAVIDIFINDLTSSDYTKACPLATVTLDVSGQNAWLTEECAKMYEYWITSVERYLIYKKKNAAREKAEHFMIAIEGALLLSKVSRDIRYLMKVKKNIKQVLK